MKNYHIYRGEKRTSISLPTILDELLAFKIQEIPDEKSSSKAVTKWLQNRADKASDHNKKRFSQWLQREVMLFIISDTELFRMWKNWRNGH